jgi:hypothetical protein
LSIEGRIKELQKKHKRLDEQVMDMEQRPICCPTELRRLKREKLHCKEEIERLSNPRRRTAPKTKKAKAKSVRPPEVHTEPSPAVSPDADLRSGFDAAA